MFNIWLIDQVSPPDIATIFETVSMTEDDKFLVALVQDQVYYGFLVEDGQRGERRLLLASVGFAEG